MSTGAKTENQFGPPSGEAAGPVKDYTSPKYGSGYPGKSSGGSGAAVDSVVPESDGQGGTK